MLSLLVLSCLVWAFSFVGAETDSQVQVLFHAVDLGTINKLLVEYPVVLFVSNTMFYAMNTVVSVQRYYCFSNNTLSGPITYGTYCLLFFFMYTF